MEIISYRSASSGDATTSEIDVNDAFECHALEDLVREPKEGRPAEWDMDSLTKWVLSWKVKEKTAIPMGRYKVGKDFSNHFQRMMVHILGVPGFDGVRMHAGLRPEDTEGCILAGDEIYDTPEGPRVKSGTTRPAAHRLEEKIFAALDNGEDVWWTFKEAT